MTDSSAPPASRADIVGVYQPVVAELRRRVLQDPVFAAALVDAIEKAKLPDVASLLEFFQLLNSMVTSLPSSTSRLLGNGLEVYFVVGQNPALQEDPNFTDWLVRFAGAMGAFMDTPASAEHLDGFIFDSPIRSEGLRPWPQRLAVVQSVLRPPNSPWSAAGCCAREPPRDRFSVRCPVSRHLGH